MCDPVTLGVVTFGVGALQTGLQYAGEKQAYATNRDTANLNFANQSNIIQQQRVQLDQQKSENALDTAISTVKAQGEVAASAASMGLSSASIVGALNADMFGIGRQVEAENTNDANQRLQLSNRLQGANIERVSQINSKTNPGVLDLAVGLGGDALKGVSAYTTAGGKF